MKNYVFFVFVFTLNTLYAQEKAVTKPEYVIIIDDKISSRDELNEYAKSGYLKNMRKGVSEAQREQLAKRLGEQVGSKEFIILISLYTEDEKEQRSKQPGVSFSAKEKLTTINDFRLNVNDAAKDFKVEMLNGKFLKLSDLKGKVVLINFWATWCAPCLMEFHDFPSKIIAPFIDSNFMLVAISRGEPKEKVAQKMASLREKGIDFNVGLDPEEVIWRLYADGGIPKNFVIDKNGIIKYTSTGYSEDNVDKLAKEIKRLLE